MSETLEEIARRYYCDKLLRHTYIPHYARLFEPMRDSARRILEIGIGHEALMRRRLPPDGVWYLGASLRMWRDYFPNAQVLGVDIKPATMFTDERITTRVVDQSRREQLEALGQHGPFDAIIDDGSHHVLHQRLGGQVLTPFVRSGGYYIIEDVRSNEADELARDLKGTVIPSTLGRKRDYMVVVEVP